MTIAVPKEIDMPAKDKLIVALDVENAATANQIIDELSDLVGAFKIGLQLFTAEGPEFVRSLTKSGHRIFLDLKFHDIPNTVAKASVEAAKLGVWMFNVHTVGGSEMMSRAENEVSEFCAKKDLQKPLMIGVTVLTSSTQSVLDEIGVRNSVDDQVVSLAKLAANAGLDGVVASPLEAEAIKNAVTNKDFYTVTPGVRPHSGTLDDQNRVTTPGSAIIAGSDYLVVGRPITSANDRRSAAKMIVDEISEALS